MTPSFSSTEQYQGPWPLCLEKEMTGTQCRRFILAHADDVDIEIVKPMEPLEMDFQTDRVRIFVNETDYVIRIPERG
jgi:hypothetical protein